MDTTTARGEYCQFGRCRPADRRAGVPLAGLCWYPIVSHPSWMMVDTAPTGSWATSMRRGSALGMSRWPANSDASRRSSVTCLPPWRERAQTVPTHGLCEWILQPIEWVTPSRDFWRDRALYSSVYRVYCLIKIG